ncbi:MAG: bifunctional UDP-sugar hydrolase/5'-nucleotidase [Vicinamibacteraceae bacterium]
MSDVPLLSLRVLAACGLLLTGACARAVAPPPSAVPASTAPLTVSIVGTNDLHGGIVARSGNGGLALLGGYVKNLRAARARDGGAVLLIDAGDMFQGTLESNIGEGAAVVAAYNVLGYTAAAVGNHEFDFGPVGKASTPGTPADDPRGALRARAAEARFPFLAANLIETATGAPPRWTNVRPTTLVDVAGIKVGVVGVMTLRALTATSAGNVVGLSIAPLTDTIRTHATALRAQGAHIVIVSAHAGGRCTVLDRPDDLSSCDPGAEILAIARALPRGLVDVIVAGHTHAGMAHQVEGIAITEAFSGGRAFGRVDLDIDRRTRTIIARRSFPPRDLCERENPATKACAAPADTALVPAEYEGAPVEPDAAVERALAPALEAVRVLKAQPIGVVLETPIRRLQPLSPLGNLVTDAMLAAGPGATVAMNNSGGGLRADLPAGPLTYGSVFEVMPFDNLLVDVRLTGRQLRQVFAASILQNRRGLGFSGIRVDGRCQAGALTVTMTRPSGAAIADDDPVQLITSNFLATGGDGILTPVMPAGGFPVDADAPLVRDLLIEYLKKPGAPVREAQLIDTTPRLQVSGPMPCAAS